MLVPRPESMSVYSQLLLANLEQIDHIRRLRIIDLMQQDPCSTAELDIAQAHCFEVMRNDSFPRFLRKATFSNIGDAEVTDRLNMTVLGFVLCAIWIPLALTQDWYARKYRFCLFLPILLFLAGALV